MPTVDPALVSEAVRNLIAEVGLGRAAVKLGLSRATTTTLAAMMPTKRGSLVQAALALGLCQLPTPLALASPPRHT